MISHYRRGFVEPCAAFPWDDQRQPDPKGGPVENLAYNNQEEKLQPSFKIRYKTSDDIEVKGGEATQVWV